MVDAPRVDADALDVALLHQPLGGAADSPVSPRHLWPFPQHIPFDERQAFPAFAAVKVPALSPTLNASELFGRAHSVRSRDGPSSVAAAPLSCTGDGW